MILLQDLNGEVCIYISLKVVRNNKVLWRVDQVSHLPDLLITGNQII